MHKGRNMCLIFRHCIRISQVLEMCSGIPLEGLAEDLDSAAAWELPCIQIVLVFLLGGLSAEDT